VVTDHLLNLAPQFGKPKTATVGTDRLSETVLSPTRRFSIGYATLPGGTVFLRGTIDWSSRRLVWEVTGGSGRYARVTGTVVRLSSDVNPYTKPAYYSLSLH